MSTARLHSSLPAPVVHAGFSVPQSKSHVLAGVQDAYWSDDEAEDADCPLCLEEMDISDLNFKPCVCGYQICRFCWHHIKENLNKRCPACRRIYTDEGVEFKPIAPEDHKRLTQQKKQRDREKKDLETLGRKHLVNVRVVQRNVVYVVGIGPRFAKEELIPTLRSNDYFGQYGKISKILLVKRSSSGGGPVVGLYITYHRKEDAARCIAAVDGVPSPGGGKDIMRASYGTTKYCMAFLRGVQCNDHSCMNFHEWGDEKDCFTKEDLATLKHTIKATENRTRTVTTRKGDEDASLPRAASWAQKGSITTISAPSSRSASSMASPISSRPTRRPAGRPPKVVTPSFNDSRPKVGSERKVLNTTSRPSTPGVGNDSHKTDSNDSKAVKHKELVSQSSVSSEPSISTSDVDVVQPDLSPDQHILDSAVVGHANLRILSSKSIDLNGIGAPPGLPIPPGLAAPQGHSPRTSVPPGLSAPPGILPQNRPNRGETESPQTPLLASQSSYQMSTAARALVEDVKARRESSMSISISPFPDFDRTLQTLCDEDGVGFSFNLDPKLANQADISDELPEFDMSSSVPFRGSYMDAFPALRSSSSHVSPPSLSHAYNPSFPIYDPLTPRRLGHQVEKGTNKVLSYVGSFNPFSTDSTMDSMASIPSQRLHYSPIDEERKVSRFGFARGRQVSTTASSPLQSSSPLSYNADHHPFYQPGGEIPASPLQLWHQQNQEQSFSLSHSSSAMHQPMQVQARCQNPFSSGDEDLSEAQLRSFIFSSQDRANISSSRPVGGSETQFISSRPFEDPAIMSASFSTLQNQQTFTSMAYGPPPGLSAPRRSPVAVVISAPANPAGDARGTGTEIPTDISMTPPSFLSIEDFPALTQCSSDPLPDSHAASREPVITSVNNVQDKAERKTLKKTSLAQKQKAIQEKTSLRLVAKTKTGTEKATEKVTDVERTFSNPELPLNVKEPLPESREDTASLSSSMIQTQATVEKRVNPKKTSKGTNPSGKRSDSMLSGKALKAPSNMKVTAVAMEDTTPQVPLLSKKPKKNRPIVKASKPPKEEDTQEEAAPPSTTDTSKVQGSALDSSVVDSRSQSCDPRRPPTSVQKLLEQLDAMYTGLDLANHPFFDPQKLASPVKMPLEYGPLVHALSALSVGGGSFANSIPSGSIDNAVSSFQQLLETLTQTISDLLRLLPRTTWDDSSSFDGVLRDMLKGDDFLDDNADDGVVREDEVAALTLALERRARWMEVQLSKLEELHRDINTAAVKAILSFNDIGWDRNNFLPSSGKSLARFNRIGTVEDNGVRRPMSADELEKKLTVAQEAVVFAETEIREAMQKYQVSKSL